MEHDYNWKFFLTGQYPEINAEVKIMYAVMNNGVLPPTIKYEVVPFDSDCFLKYPDRYFVAWRYA